MSTNPIIVSIVDQVDTNIQVKINGIGASARDAALQVSNLTAALAGLSGVQVTNLNNLGAALGSIKVAAQIAPDVNNLSKSLGSIAVAAAPAINAGTSLADSIKLIKPAAAATETALLDMAFALRNVSNGVQTIPNLATAVNLIPPVARQADAALVGMAGALAGINSGATLAQRAGTSLADAWRLITPVAQKSDAQLLNMGFALRAVAPAAGAAGTAADTLEKRLANLLSRVIGTQLGIGRLGGAIGGIATQVVALGPLLVALLAIAAVAGAILLYEKFRREANELADSQAALGKEVGASSDKLLQQKERLAELTSGPMAQYAQAIRDIRFETDNIDFSNILKDLEKQQSYFERIDAAVENIVANLIKYASLKFANPANTGALVDIRDTELFLREEEAKRQQGTLTTELTKQQLQEIVAASQKAAQKITFDRKTQLEIEIADLRKQLDLQNALLADQVGSRSEIQNKANRGLQQALNQLLVEYQSYLQKRNILIAEADKAASEEQLRQFKEERTRLKATAPGGFVSAQDELKLVQQQLAGAPRPTEVPGLDSLAARSGAMGGNVRKLKQEEAELTGQINHQTETIKELTDRYRIATERTGAYDDALKSQVATENIVNELKRKGIPIDDATNASMVAQLDSIKQMTLAEQAEIRIGRQRIALYNEFRAPEEAHNATLTAANQLADAGKLSQEELNISYRKANETLKRATDPLYDYNLGLQKQNTLLQEYGQNLAVDTQILELQYKLKAEGRELDAAQLTQLRQTLTDQERQKNVQADLNELWANSIGAQQKNIDHQKALNKAIQDGIISLEQYKNGTIQVALAQIALQNAQGKGGLKSNVVQIFGSMVDLSKTTVQKMTEIWSGFFGTMKKGFADSLAHALVFGGSLKQGLIDVARNAVAQLISSFIQLGIELLIIDGLSHLPGMKRLFDMMKQGHTDAKEQAVQLGVAIASILAITAVQLAAISALMGPAWSLAEAVSLFSFGANAAPAAAGIGAVVAAGAAAQGASKGGGLFAEGGLITGPGGPKADRIPIMASDGEFVVNAASTKRYRAVLEAINNGRVDRIPFAPKFMDGGYVSDSSYSSGAAAVRANAMHVNTNVQMKINVVHDGSTNVQVEQIDETTVRIIAQREAKTAVQQYAPGVIATDLHNPNSNTSKAVNRNLVAPRRR